MNRLMHFVRALAVLVVVAVLAAPALAGTKEHRLALQISDKDPQKMSTVLNVAANVSRLYAERGEEVQIAIVAFNAGLHMLREDTAPDDVKARVLGFAKSMPNVTFQACNNTLEGMAKKEGKTPPLVGNAKIVPAGVVTLIELNEAGWTIVRP
ncbi:hypothetical protein BAL199_09218 [alpha proteobacterium BAL199]|jgi:uncharacterized protein|nr:hypothetical protein BAL199_09218 [alpha proteobacterium BAL199]